MLHGLLEDDPIAVYMPEKSFVSKDIQVLIHKLCSVEAILRNRVHYLVNL